MDKRNLIRAIFAAIESWSKLDDKQKGQNFQNSVDRLNNWAKELKEN